MRKTGGYAGTADLFSKVAESMSSQPLPDSSRALGYVTEESLVHLKAIATAATVLGELEARGAILPTSPHTYPLEQHNWNAVSTSEHGTAPIANLQGDFSLGLSAGYRLPVRDSRAPLVDSPGVFLLRPPASMGAKVLRALEESVNAYRNALYLSTAVMLGVASEAAWGQLARTLQAKRPNTRLSRLLADPYVSAAALHRKTSDLLRQELPDRAADIDAVDLVEQTYREIRNYAAHRPDEAFDETKVTRPIVGLLLDNSVDYFRRIYELHDALLASP